MPFYVAVGGAALHLSHQLFTLDIDDVSDCWAKFVSNTKLGLLIFIGIVAGRLFAEKEHVNVEGEQDTTQADRPKGLA